MGYLCFTLFEYADYFEFGYKFSFFLLFFFFLPSHVHSEKIDLLKDKRREYFSSAEAIDVRCM